MFVDAGVDFAAASAALHRLGLPGILGALHAAGLAISRSVLGGSHSVAVYPPIDSLSAIDADSVIGAIRFRRDTSLYIHLPFCETRCTFCHYTVQRYTGRADPVVRYLQALKRELAFWGARLARSGTGVSSIYIGGGTPLVLEICDLDDLLRAIRDHYEILPGAEICVEGSPLTITAPDGEEKLRFLEQHGVTRLSFGVQSFDEAVLKFSARGHKRDTPIQAARIASSIFDNWNIDLVQGLYKGSPTETWQNLRTIAELQPAHLTWYHGRFADRPQGQWLRSGDRHESFEDELETLLGRMLIWQGMAALGYQQIDGNRFVRDARHVDPFKKIRTSASRDMLGVGTSSYSHVGADHHHGFVFRNDAGIDGYVDRVHEGNVPIATGRAIDDNELLAMSYATGLRGGRIETPELRAIAAKTRLAGHYQALVGTLSGLGVLEPYANGEGARLTELGRLFEDETLALFFSPAVQRALAPAPERKRLALVENRFA